MFPVLSANGPSGYTIANSLRFQAASSQSASRTTGTSTSATTWTWSAWVKRGQLGTVQALFSGGSGGGSSATTSMIYFDNTDILSVQFSGGVTSVSTSAVYRDPAAWYHIVVKVATTTATIYVNGTQIATGTVTPTYINAISTIQYIGWQNYSTGSTRYFDGYQTEIVFVDGQALNPSSFGQTDAVTGQWVAKKYAGTYGTNGFYLPFTNGTSTTTLGADSSGNSNNWTLTNFTRSAGVSDCWMYDVPSGNGSSVGGTQPNSNYADINPLIKGSYSVVSNANLKVAGSTGNSYNSVMSTIGMSSGKWYCEVTATSVGGSPAIGICLNTQTLGAGGATAGYVGDASGGYSYFTDGSKFHNATQTTGYGSTWTTGDVIGMAFDADAGSITFYKNNVSQGVAYSSISMTQFWFFGVSTYLTTDTFNINFGQRSFSYTPPTGFKALCTANLPVATIKQGNKYMDATLYTGNGSTQTITNAGSFKPDLVWVKSRSAATDHKLTDSVRGVQKGLISDTTGAETTDTNGLTAFNSNGWSLGTDTVYNANAATFVGWQWQAGQGSTSSNTNGSITSTTSVNATAGFSVVTYTSQTSGTATVGHGLGVAPAFIITKQRASVGGWTCYHQSLGNTNVITLNSTAATSAASTVWNNTSPTSSVVTLGTGFAGAGTMVAYCFAEIAGFSKFGSYTGNGSADGTFVYLGFRPRWVLIKASSTTDDWYLYDSSRSTYNLTNLVLFPDLTIAESTGVNAVLDFLSNGFKCRGIANINTGSITYIYAAFAENPFAQANAR